MYSRDGPVNLVGLLSGRATVAVFFSVNGGSDSKWWLQSLDSDPKRWLRSGVRARVRLDLVDSWLHGIFSAPTRLAVTGTTNSSIC